MQRRRGGKQSVENGAANNNGSVENSFHNGTTNHQPEHHRRECHHSIAPLEEFSIQYHARIVTTESFLLLKYLVHGTSMWIAQLTRLLCFVVALLPAFVTFLLFYTVNSDRIAVSYVSGKHKTSRHYLDIYGSTVYFKESEPQQKKIKKPVVIFLTGGAWIIGYKMWCTLLARTLVPFGILVVIPDYRNFPQTDIEGMIQDADEAIQFTLAQIAEYGGDPNKVVLAGQSAGAHIGACLLLRKSQQQQPQPKNMSTDNSNNKNHYWQTNAIKGFIAVSGPYDLISMRDVLHKRGLDKSIVNAMFCNDVAKYSPTRQLQDLAEDIDDDIQREQQQQQIRNQFPATCVIHGKMDKTVPYQISVDFYEALQDMKLKRSLELTLYPTWSHTDPILEAPFAGNHLFHRYVYDLVKRWTFQVEGEESALFAFDENHAACRKICPEFLVEIARFCNPF